MNRLNSRTVNICGVEINNLSIQEVLSSIVSLIEDGKPSFVATCNVDHIIKLKKDAEFKKVYDSAVLVVPDGVPLLWASNLFGTPLKERVNGTDLFELLCELSARNGFRIFLLGGRSHAASLAADVLRKRYEGISITGTYSPPIGFEFDPAENSRITDMIKSSGCDILFVGLGAPKQEKWIYRFKDEYKAPVSIGIGVSFEFVAGMVKRAPRWMQVVGLEWFWRLLMEPARLWKRYLIDDMQFFWLVLKQKFSK